MIVLKEFWAILCKVLAVNIFIKALKNRQQTWLLDLRIIIGIIYQIISNILSKLEK